VARHWLGIDIGGTFTDFALFDTQTGELLGLKIPSTPPEFAEAVRVGLDRWRTSTAWTSARSARSYTAPRLP
jgi:N-methylhydantoinase A/oxoprolinase/acetone carboxylase beta subunit